MSTTLPHSSSQWVFGETEAPRGEVTFSSAQLTQSRVGVEPGASEHTAWPSCPSDSHSLKSPQSKTFQGHIGPDVLWLWRELRALLVQAPASSPPHVTIKNIKSQPIVPMSD